MTPEERAVIEAAKAWRVVWRSPLTVREAEVDKALCQAVDALRAIENLGRGGELVLADGHSPAEPPAEAGQVAYEGYFAACGGKSLVSGAPLPTWDEQRADIRDAWLAAASAVLGGDR